jgi:hypothetical protein|tara:strand:+ start:548 stop:970 length:423 start_codon:yes stop_codon:yes gene_type:complete
MATTTATITLASTDIADNALSVSNTMTLTTAGTTTGVTETTGLARLKMASTTLTDLITVANVTGFTAAKSGKVYIKNTGTSTEKFGIIGIGDSGGTPTTIGRLYGGDWMLFPWDGNSGEDITIDMSDATETIIEYMVFFE